MNNEEVLNAFANKMLSAVEELETFGKEQIPDYIEQVLMFNFWSGVSYIVLWGIFGAVLIGLALFGVRKKKQNPRGEWEILVILGGIFGALAVILPIVINTSDLIKIKVAPKVYIVDYIRTTLK